MTVTELGQLPPAEWYATEVPFRDDIGIGTLLLAAAAEHALSPALIVGAPGHPRVLFSYAELAAEARRVAWLLRRRIGLRIGDHAVVIGYHSPATVVGILGCLLAGVSYVPVDPRWPVARRREVLAAVRGRVVFAAPTDLGWLAATSGVTEVITLFAGPVREAWRQQTALLWDSVSRAVDPAEAAGFNLSGAPIDPAEVAHYADHVAALVAGTGPATVTEIGFGSGLILRRLPAAVPELALLSGIEPAPAAVLAARDWADAEGLFADFVEGFADEIGDLLPGPHDTVLLASVVQFFPDLRYLARVLDAVAAVLVPGGTVVLADLIPPGCTPVPGLLEVDPAFFGTLTPGPLASGPRAPDPLAPGPLTASAWHRVEIRERDPAGWSGVLGARYDVLLHRSTQQIQQLPMQDGSVQDGSVQDGSVQEGGSPDPGTGSAVRVWTSMEVADLPDQVPDPPPGPDDCAYVIFTSGSTGSPKGVRIGHRAVVNLVDWILGKYRLGPGDTALQAVSFSFDLSVFDVAGILSSGAALRLLADPLLAEPSEIARVLQAEPITFWNSAPAALSWVLPFTEPGAGRLRLAFLSGDWIPLSMPEEIRRFAPAAQPVSLGGATEATVWSNDFVIGAVDPSWPSIPYGRPMQNARYYVLDERLRPVPIGVEGDLFIAGIPLAEGYHDDPVRTALAFLPDSLAGHGRMYRTGDRARWRPDGELEFLGRLDQQVKIRGYRVELEEIESVVARQPGVRSCATVAVPAGGDRRLACFYTTGNAGPEPDAVRAACAAALPGYSVPTVLDRLDSLPVTSNGKVDRAALVARAAERIRAGSG